MIRVSIALALAIITTTLVASVQLACSERARHNVVLITLDTLRADRLGAYGYDGNTSPTIDALAARGVRFDDAIAQSTTTPPSHASILTGLNPTTHGLRRLYGQRLPQTNETLAEILRADGYTTAAFVSAVPLRADVALDQGFDVYEDSWPSAGPEPEHDRPAEATNEAVFSWLETKPAQPVFLWVHYFDPHYPYFPPEEYRKRFGVMNAIEEFFPVPANANPQTAGPAKAAPPRPKLVDKLSRLYDAEIAYMDAAIAALLARLSEAGILDDAIIAFVADHGEHLGEAGYYWGHWDILEETASVPMLLVHPDGRYAGMEVRDAVGTIDLVPTLLAWLGLEPALDFDGIDLTQLLDADAGEREPRVFYTEQFEYFPTRSVRDGEWFLQQRAQKQKPMQSGEVALYRRWPGTYALERVIDRPDVEQRLRVDMYRFARPENRHATDKIRVSDEVRDQLRALGYTNEAGDAE